ncbi:MAG: DNA-processing protein DprA [Paracoccaceae bacterium]|nr:DNA-processing protein DprA [Paracoccaceae bacterium]
MSEFGSAGDALAALPGIAAEAGVEDYAPCPPAVARAELEAGHRAGAVAIAIGSEAYPALLAEISDPPPILWALGDIGLLDRPATALIGARAASSLGLRMARRLARELGEAGHVVVSGLARGIDTEGHKTALETGTIAVLPGGVDVVYPSENAVLAQEIGERGLLLSERPMHAEVHQRHFIQRNRIIAGLARATVVVEAAAKSGSQSTARFALDQGRDVLAVPGHPFDARSAGSNMLIRDGATLIRGARDVLEALATTGNPVARSANRAPTSRPGPKAPCLADTAALHTAILDRLAAAPLAEDALIRALGAQAADIAREIVTLELDGRIRRDPGGQLIRAA